MARQRVSSLDTQLFATCTWDLETSNLQASIGFLLCCVIKPWAEDPIVFRIDESPNYDHDRSNDRWIAKRIKETLEEFDIAIAYNGQRFDAPFLNTRLMIHNLKPMAIGIKHLDPLYAARYRMRLHSNRLETVIETLNLKTKKTPLNGNIWIKAAVGVKQAMDQVVDHCVKDAYALEATTRRLIKLMDMKFSLIR